MGDTLMPTPLFPPLIREPRVPVLYLGLDGTVRWGKDELGRFVNGPDDVRVFDGVPELLARYKEDGWRIIAVSNQGGIALGMMTMRECADAMALTQKLTGDAFDKIAWCSHHPDSPYPEMSRCWCRKPKPGLLIEAALMLASVTNEVYPPHLALMVGDRPEDRACAEGVGIDFMDAAEWRKGEHAEKMTA